jgi:hypothetical protein
MFEQWLVEWHAWWSTLTPEFAFLLALPFLVGALGLAGDAVRRCRGKHRGGA